MGKSLKVVNTNFGLVPEKLSEASPSRLACAECALHEGCSEPFIKPFVPESWSGRYLFVIETTREGEESYRRNGLPIGERERVQLKSILSTSNIERDDVAFVPVLRCRPVLTGSKKPKMVNLRACRPFLRRAINELNPAVVVAFGENAVKSLTNTGAPGPVALLRGRELCMPTPPDQPKQIAHFYCTHKLASTLVDPHAKARIAEDLRRLMLPITAHPAKNMPTAKGEIGFDTEYTGETVHCLAVADECRAITVKPSEILKLTSLLSKVTLVGHNIAVDLEALLRLKPKGLKLAMEQWLQGRRIRDTLLEARLADENRGKYGYKLESLATSLFNTKDWKQPTEALGPDSSVWPPQLRDERCRLDAWATFMVHEKLQGSIVGPVRLSHAIAMSLRRMYWAGVYIDEKKFTEMRTQVYKERAKSFQILKTFANKFGIEEFTATDRQLREYVYGKDGAGLTVESYTPGGLPSVSVKNLKEYKDEKAIQALLTFSKNDKLQTTYCDSLAAKASKVGCNRLWMPVAINPLATKTGRRTSNAPNFQNWPVSVRQIIVSRFKGGNIADNDYSKLEPILGGWVAGEPKLTEYFVKYSNGYIKIGEDFFKKTVVKNTKEYTMMKALVLAIIYNKKRRSLAEDMWVTQGVKLDSDYEKHVDKCGQLLEDFLDLFPGVRRYHKAQEEAVLTTGCVYNAVGQCRRLPLPEEPPRGEKGAYKAWLRHKAHVVNQGINFPIQSLAAYVTGCALIDLEAAFLKEWGYSYVDYQMVLMEKCWPNMPLLSIEVHDDLVMDIPKGLEARTREITNYIMCKPPSLVAVLPELWDSNVQLSIDTNVSSCWGMKS